MMSTFVYRGANGLDDSTEPKPRTSAIVALLLLPLAVIAFQRAMGLHGVQNSLYKLFLLIPPLLYCRTRRIGVRHQILAFHQWRHDFGFAVRLGITACAIFWGAYLELGNELLDKERIGNSVSRLFVTNAHTVLYVAPITVFANSLLEEFFYRGFAFGLLVRRHRLLGYILPAIAFTAQHVLFFWYWMDWIPFCVAVAGLMTFALIQQRLYESAGTIVAPWVVHMFGDFALMGIAVQLFYSTR